MSLNYLVTAKAMAAVDVGARGNPPVSTDDLDDIFDYDVPKDIFQDVNTNMDLPPLAARAPLGDASAAGVGLGIDEEVKVAKRRAPVAKLDESRYVPGLIWAIVEYSNCKDFCPLPESQSSGASPKSD